MQILNNILNNLKIKISCQKVGDDEFGNQYFINKKNKRFVIYKGIAEPSKIPAEWHGWIHYSVQNPPSNPRKYYWQKIHLPNLTGTKSAYSPKNSASSSQYQAWNPNK